MTGDVQTNEFSQFQAVGARESRRRIPAGAAALHEYGRLIILDGPETDDSRRAREAPPPALDMSRTEVLGAAALAERNSEAFKAEKRARRYEGLSWGAETPGGPRPLDSDVVPEPDDGSDEAAEPAARLTGRVAVGRIIVSGPTSDLRFSDADVGRVEAEVQEGLSWLGSRSPARDVTFVHDVRLATVNAPVTTSAPAGGDPYEPFEAPWRDAALRSLGLDAGTVGVRSYLRQMRAHFDADWAYVAFFTKYPLRHYAYSYRANSKVVMEFQNGGWASIDRVFAHETGHIFSAPDEYVSANASCDCGGAFGPFRRPNRNCVACAPGGGVGCLMKDNSWRMCAETPYHLGYNGLPPPPGV